MSQQLDELLLELRLIVQLVQSRPLTVVQPNYNKMADSMS